MSADIQNYVSVTITTNSASVTRTGFGIPMLLGYFPTSISASRVLTYNGNTGLSDMVTAGFAITDPLYLMATALLSQSPRVSTFKVGRLQVHQQKHEVNISSIAVGEIVELTVIDESGTSYSYAQTATSTDVTSAATNLAASMTAGISTLSTTVVGSTLTSFAKTSGDVYYYFDNLNCSLEDVTLDPGYASDFALIKEADDTWYGSGIDVNSYAITDALATWTETQRKICLPHSNDTNISTTDDDDIGTELYDDSRKRTALIYHHTNDLRQYPGVGWMGKCFPKDPGRQTWMYKNIAGADVSALTSTEKTNLDGKNVNYLHNLGGVNITEPGQMADGSTTTYIDIVRLTDWIQANIQEDILAALANNDKLPYTDATIDLVNGIIFGVYKLAAERDGTVLADYVFDATAAGDQTSANRLARLMAGITFAGTFAAGVHKFTITGSISQ